MTFKETQKFGIENYANTGEVVCEVGWNPDAVKKGMVKIHIGDRECILKRKNLTSLLFITDKQENQHKYGSSIMKTIKDEYYDIKFNAQYNYRKGEQVKARVKIPRLQS